MVMNALAILIPAIVAVIAIRLIWLVRSMASARSAHRRRLPGTKFFYDPTQGADPERLAEASRQALTAVKGLWRPEGVDVALNDFMILVQPENAWVDDYGRKVAGLTHLTSRSVEVGKNLVALAHEFAHVCEGRLDGATDSTHVSWASPPRGRGIYDAINGYEVWALSTAA